MRDDRARWRELDETATPGPWDLRYPTRYLNEADRPFIAAARMAWPAAEREVEQLRALLRRVRDSLVNRPEGANERVWATVDLIDGSGMSKGA